MPRPKRPRNGPRASARPFLCGLCNKGFSRRLTVKEPHFQSCVRKNGNPDNQPWDSHPTCWVRRSDGTRGPSGSSPPKTPYKWEQDKKKSGSVLSTPSRNSMSATDPSRYRNTIQPEQQQGEDRGSSARDDPAPQTPLNPYHSMPSQTEQQQREQDGSSSSPVLPTYPDPETPLVPYRSVPHPSSQIPSTPPSQLISPYRLLPCPTNGIPPSSSGQLPSPYCALSHLNNEAASSSSGQLPSFASLGLPKPVSSISSLAMNQIANIPIGLTREKAGINDEEALRMWTMWFGLLPDGVRTSTSAPKPGASQQERQQAVVWLAQDVYAGFLAKAEGRFLDRLGIVKVLRDVVWYLNDEDAVGRIHELLVGELGEAGPGMLA